MIKCLCDTGASTKEGGVFMQEFIKANSINEITEGLPKDTVVGEFAGRDSVAAFIKALEYDSID